MGDAQVPGLNCWVEASNIHCERNGTFVEQENQKKGKRS